MLNHAWVFLENESAMHHKERIPRSNEANRAREVERIAAAPLLRIERGGFRYPRVAVSRGT